MPSEHPRSDDHASAGSVGGEETSRRRTEVTDGITRPGKSDSGSALTRAHRSAGRGSLGSSPEMSHKADAPWREHRRGPTRSTGVWFGGLALRTTRTAGSRCGRCLPPSCSPQRRVMRRTPKTQRSLRTQRVDAIAPRPSRLPAARAGADGASLHRPRSGRADPGRAPCSPTTPLARGEDAPDRGLHGSPDEGLELGIAKDPAASSGALVCGDEVRELDS